MTGPPVEVIALQSSCSERPALLLCLLDLGAEFLRVRIVQGVENLSGLPPGGECGLRVPGCVPGLAKTCQHGCLTPEVAESGVKLERPGVAVTGLGMMGKAAVGVSQAAPGGGLAGKVAECAE